jgi:hypothetical protein
MRGGPAALKGYRLQALYCLARILGDSSDDLFQYRLEGVEDLEIRDSAGQAVEFVQVKAYSDPLSLSGALAGVWPARTGSQQRAWQDSSRRHAEESRCTASRGQRPPTARRPTSCRARNGDRRKPAARPAGFEPATSGLEIHRSSAELRAQMREVAGDLARFAGAHKASGACVASPSPIAGTVRRSNGGKRVRSVGLAVTDGRLRHSEPSRRAPGVRGVWRCASGTPRASRASDPLNARRR